MQENENMRFAITIVIYSLLTRVWFDLNNNDLLPFIGHTNLVNWWINEYASKTKLLFDLIYFSISTATIIVVTSIILSKVELPFILHFKDADVYGVSSLVNLVVLLYEFHVLEFRFKLIGLTIALIIFFFIAYFIAEKVLSIVKPILGIIDAAETINDISEINDKK